MTTQYVYVLVDAADQPIYVGVTGDPARRVREHRAKPWWVHVSDVEIYPQVDRQMALFVERDLIRQWSPEFNRQSVDPVQHFASGMFRPMVRALYEEFAS